MNLFGEAALWRVLLSAVGGYLLGNIETALIISKRILHDDIRSHGSGNAGSTNMVRVFGWKHGIYTFIGDFLKAVFGVLLGRYLAGEAGGYLGGLCAVIGHCYPVFAGLKGGKGVASSFAVLWMCFPLGAAITTGVIVLVFVLTKRVSVMSLAGIVAAFILSCFLEGGNIPLVVLIGLLTVIIYIRHMDNIRRLLKGEEKKFIN